MWRVSILVQRPTSSIFLQPASASTMRSRFTRQARGGEPTMARATAKARARASSPGARRSRTGAESDDPPVLPFRTGGHRGEGRRDGHADHDRRGAEQQRLDEHEGGDSALEKPKVLRMASSGMRSRIDWAMVLPVRIRRVKNTAPEDRVHEAMSAICLAKSLRRNPARSGSWSRGGVRGQLSIAWRGRSGAGWLGELATYPRRTGPLT